MGTIKSESQTPFDSSAGVPPAVAGPSRPRFGSVKIHDRGRLPHWEKEGATYFVTFRLADSLPQAFLERIASERQAIRKTASELGRPLSADEQHRLRTLSSKAVEQYLDNGVGACHLSNPAIANEVEGTLRHFDERRYRLFAWCIMPNHVHALFKIFPGHSLPGILHSWKSFTAKRANAVLGSKGHFWQREYYDHLIRSQEEFERAVRYIVANPEKAKLKHWRWLWQWRQDAATTAAETAALRSDQRSNP